MSSQRLAPTSSAERLRSAVVGVDIGGTKVAAGLVDDSGRLVRAARAMTPHGEGAEAVLSVVVDLVDQLRNTTEVLGVGIGSPGVIDPDHGVVVSATDVLPEWVGAPVRGEVTRRTGLPVVVDNDVRVMAYGEATYGASSRYGRALHVSIGTGIGGAITCNRRVEHGRHGTAGEIAHLLIPEQGHIKCGCGRFDHLESVACGPAIAAAYAARTRATPITASEIIGRMHAGDSDAAEVILQTASILGRTLAGLCTAIDVDAIVVAGGVAQAGDAFLGPVAKALQDEVLPPLRGLPVLAATLGTNAPIIGAAKLAADVLGQQR